MWMVLIVWYSLAYTIYGAALPQDWPIPTIVSRHLINFDFGKRFMQKGVYEPFLYYVDLFVL